MRRAIFLLLAFLILYPLTYISLVAISNRIFGGKKPAMDNNAPVGVKREKVLKIISFPVALFILYVLASFLSATV